MSTAQPAVRYRLIDRSKVSPVSLDEQLPDHHPVRALWDFVCQLPLDPFRKPAKAVAGHPGNPVVPVELLFALWLFATTEGIHSSHELAERCTRDLPYQWLCGGRSVSYGCLNNFYAAHGEALQDCFVEYIAALRQQGLIDLVRATVDGRKVIANASKDCYRREGTLQRHLQEAQEHLHDVRTQRDEAGQASARQAAARARGARERLERLQAALEVVRQRQQQRQETGRKDSQPEQARANETDPDCAKMKMPDGGYQQAFNVETVTDERHGLIVTVAVINQGSDNGQLAPLVDKVETEQGVLPAEALADSGFVSQEDIHHLESKGVKVLMPPKNEKQEKEAGKDPYARKRRDSDAVAAWRARLSDPESRQRYRRRAPVAEGVHAQEANRGWRRFRVRGLVKAQTEALWQALAHNVKVLLSLGVSLAPRVRAEGA